MENWKNIIRATLLFCLEVAITAPAALSQETDAISIHGDWSVFTDNEVCWVASLALDGTQGDDSPMLFVTFKSETLKPEISVFDPRKFGGGDKIAIVVGERFYALDIDRSDNTYAFDNNWDLMSVLSLNGEARVFFESESGKIEDYPFSLFGFNAAIEAAKDACPEMT